MTERKPRRQVFAELLLTCSPREMTEYPGGTMLGIDFDSIAELHQWLTRTGLHTADLLITPESTDTDAKGRIYRRQAAYPTWHGWEIYANAREYASTPSLDEMTTARLAELAEVTA